MEKLIKKSLFLIFGILILVWMVINLSAFSTLKFSICCVQSKKNIPETPIIYLKDSIYYLGKVNPQLQGDFEITLSNLGHVPLIIEEIKSTCSCLTLKAKSLTVLPGESKLITVHYRFDQIGMNNIEIHRGILIYSNDPLQPVSEVWITARVR